MTQKAFRGRFGPGRSQCARAGSRRPTRGEARPPGRKWWRRGRGRRRTRRSRAGAEGTEGDGSGGWGGRLEGWTSRRRRGGVQSAGGLALAVANQPPPRARCLAPRAFLHHVRVRWAAAGYKRLRPSGRPPFWGSFRGKFGCSVAWTVTFFPKTGGPGKRIGDGWFYPVAALYRVPLLSGATRNGTWECFMATRTDYIFLLLCSFFTPG